MELVPCAFCTCAQWDLWRNSRIGDLWGEWCTLPRCQVPLMTRFWCLVLDSESGQFLGVPYKREAHSHSLHEICGSAYLIFGSHIDMLTTFLLLNACWLSLSCIVMSSPKTRRGLLMVFNSNNRCLSTILLVICNAFLIGYSPVRVLR